MVVVRKFKYLKEKLNQQKFSSLYLETMFILGKLSKRNPVVIQNICNLLRAAQSLESSLHIPIKGWAKERESEYSPRKAQTIVSIFQTRSTI